MTMCHCFSCIESFHCWLQRLLRERDSKSKQLADVECDHEAAVVKLSECENRIKTMDKELKLQAQVHKQVEQQLN